MATREVVKVSGKSVAAFFERWQPGTRVECIDNTYRAASIGMAGVVEHHKKTSNAVRFDETGKLGWLRVPEKVSKVTGMTDDTVTYAIFSDTLDHTATWRIVSEATA